MDQNVNAYRIGVREKKWWWPLFTLSVDVSVQNAWFLHCEDCPIITQLEFRQSIAYYFLTKNRVTRSRA